MSCLLQTSPSGDWSLLLAGFPGVSGETHCDRARRAVETGCRCMSYRNQAAKAPSTKVGDNTSPAVDRSRKHGHATRGSS